jgi:hypothetical protein
MIRSKPGALGGAQPRTARDLDAPRTLWVPGLQAANRWEYFPGK